MPFLRVGEDDMVFEFAAGLLRGTQWHVDLAVCQDPCCPCLQCQAVWSPVAVTDTADAPHRFWVDLEKRCLERPPPEDEAAFAEVFLAQATADDWGNLLTLFRQAKRTLCAAADLTALDADFPFEEIESNGRLIAFHDILPFCEPRQAVLAGQTYHVVDQYCLNPKCDCRDAHLSFCADDPVSPGGEPTASERFTVLLDLTQRTWKMLRPAAPPAEAAALVREYLAQGDPYPELAEHRRVLRALYKHNRHKFVAEPVRADAKTGRNDPCPCGSGRKYKKCCMGKTT